MTITQIPVSSQSNCCIRYSYVIVNIIVEQYYCASINWSNYYEATTCTTKLRITIASLPTYITDAVTVHKKHTCKHYNIILCMLNTFSHYSLASCINTLMANLLILYSLQYSYHWAPRVHSVQKSVHNVQQTFLDLGLVQTHSGLIESRHIIWLSTSTTAH